MKTTLKIFTLTAILFGFATISYAQSSADGTASAGANILTALSISIVTDLHFGDMVSQTAGFTVTLPTTGTRSSSNEAALINGNTNVSVAEFKVDGHGSQKFKIELPTTVTIKNDDDEEMTVTGWNHDAGSAPALSSGTKNFKVGATLNVGAEQAVGEYTGTFDVTVTYE